MLLVQDDLNNDVLDMMKGLISICEEKDRVIDDLSKSVKGSTISPSGLQQGGNKQSTLSLLFSFSLTHSLSLSLNFLPTMNIQFNLKLNYIYDIIYA
jgi:hypothetical protein